MYRLRRALTIALSSWLLVAACSGGSSPSAAPSSAAMASPASGGMTWTPLADPSVFAAADVVDTVAGGPGVVAVGAVNKDGHQVATVWTSADGESWTQAPGEPGFTNQVLSYITQLGGGFVALAFQCPPEGGGECVGERVWTSSDAVKWQRGQFPQLLESGEVLCCEVTNLTTAGPGVVATAAAIGKPAKGEVITSPDGKVWTVMPRHPSWLKASLIAVAAGGPGIVAVGTNADETFGAWTSTDGTTWTQAAAVSGKASGEVRDLVAGGPGLVAVGRDGTSAAVWTSSDGQAWTRLPDGDALAGGTMNRVTVANSTLVSVGKAGADGALWTSPDGLAWTKQTPDAFKGYQLTNVVPVDGRIVVFGRTATAKLGVWTGELP